MGARLVEGGLKGPRLVMVVGGSTEIWGWLRLWARVMMVMMMMVMMGFGQVLMGLGVGARLGFRSMMLMLLLGYMMLLLGYMMLG